MVKDFLKNEGKFMKLYGNITEEVTYMLYYIENGDGQRKFGVPH